MRLQVIILVNGLTKYQENVFLVGAKKFVLFTGDGKVEAELTDGLRKDKTLIGDGLNEIPFQDHELLIYKEPDSNKKGRFHFTLELRRRKNRLTDYEKVTEINVARVEPGTAERKQTKRGLKNG